MLSINENKLKKWINYSSRSINMEDTYPDIMQIELCSFCNYSCVFCPHEKMTRSKGYMNINLYKSIIDQCTHVNSIGLHHMGEPLLHPNIESFIKYAEDKNIKTTISTNGSLLTKDKSYSIIQAGLSRIIITFEVNDENEYLKSRNHDIHKVYDNIIGFLNEKLKTTGKTPYVSMKMIVRPETRQNVEQFKEEWTNKAGVDQVLLNDERNWAGSLIRHNEYTNRNGAARFPCRYLWESVVILWDGTVVPCCKDYDASNNIGNANNQSLLEIWNGDKIKNLRRLHAEGLFNCGLCENCNEWRGHEKLNKLDAIKSYENHKQTKEKQKSKTIYYKQYDKITPESDIQYDK